MDDLFYGPVSDLVRAFVADLGSLCEKHGVVLSVSGYDALQVWRRTGEDAGPIHAPAIEDKTGGAP